MAHLLVTLAVDQRGVLVRWRLDDVALQTGELLGQMPLSIAGAPTLQIDDEIMAATDGLGVVPLVTSLIEGEDGKQRNHDPRPRRWSFAVRTAVSPEP